MTMQPWQAPARDVVDGWANQIAAVIELAGIVGDSAFVPKSYQDAGGAAAIAAAVLTGREIGIGPMTALAHFAVINGRPAMSSQLMRALAYRDGHRIHIKEATGATCTVEGERADGTFDEVTWTADMARAAGLTGKPVWKSYPRAMLVARATGELCRRLFPDAIGGMTLTIEEATDLDGTELPTKRATRTMRRATIEPPPAPAAGGPPAGPTPSTRVTPPAPPLPDTPPPPAPPQNQTLWPEPDQGDTNTPPPPPQPPQADTGSVKMTSAQRAMIMAQLSDLGLREPAAKRHYVVSGLVGRRISSLTQLTRDQASAVIDTLSRRLEEQMTPVQFDELVEAGIAAIPND